LVATQDKLEDARKESHKQIDQLQKKLAKLGASDTDLAEKVRDLEQQNDEYESKVRAS
jgi:cell division protein FtsB